MHHGMFLSFHTCKLFTINKYVMHEDRPTRRKQERQRTSRERNHLLVYLRPVATFLSRRLSSVCPHRTEPHSILTSLPLLYHPDLLTTQCWITTDSASYRLTCHFVNKFSHIHRLTTTQEFMVSMRG